MKKLESLKANSQQGFTLIDQSAQRGFTLIELSIVLVIIGLIVGGVLVGQDLIKTAQIRATITQIGQYNAAVNSFHAKYNGYPGDVITPEHFFAVTGDAGTQGLADGNGLIEAEPANAAGISQGETDVAWFELAQSGAYGDSQGSSSFTSASALPGTILPQTKIGRGSVAFRSGGGQNYWEISTIGGTEAANTAAAGLTPVEALALDGKMDDGIANSGTVLALANTTAGLGAPQTYSGTGHATGALVSGDCVDTTLNVYATANQASSNGVGCSISIRASY